MCKGNFIIILILFNVFHANAQIKMYEIHIEKVVDEKKSIEQYKLVNPEDAKYIRFIEHGDFGKIDWTDFRIKDTLPDGGYKIYVNNNINKEFFIKNGLKDSKWTEYRENGERSVSHFYKGKIKGVVIEYYKNKDVKRKTFVRNSATKYRISYSESGNIKLKEYFKNDKQYKIKVYDEAGKVKQIRRIEN
jgi:antitoxin component YwqK of YwqJK toxin-antitoxin module